MDLRLLDCSWMERQQGSQSGHRGRRRAYVGRVLAAIVHSAMLALVFIGVVMFGFQAWINNVQNLAQ